MKRFLILLSACLLAGCAAPKATFTAVPAASQPSRNSQTAQRAQAATATVAESRSADLASSLAAASIITGDKARVFTKAEMTADKLIPITVVSLATDYFAPPDDPRFYITFPLTIKPGQLQPGEYISVAIWRGGHWQEHTRWEPSPTITSTWTWKWYADDSIGQYYYTYLPRVIIATDPK